MRGNIVTPWAQRAKEYSWNLCLEHAPRKITPTDIDYFVESKGHFLFFEMKTKGQKMPYGQELAFTRLLSALYGRAVLMIVSHGELATVKLPIDVLSLDLWADGRGHGLIRREGLDRGLFVPLYAAFFSWAEGDTGAFKRVLNQRRAA